MIDNAEHYIGCDSGLTHLAACTATPTTVLCGPTDPSEALPPDITNVITSPLPCAPCDRDGVPACGENSCMAKIDVTEVLRIIQKKSSAHKDMQSL
ncbi:glycosyltransferase family 9 protein [Seleniivibrio woodruffii]|uniref:glycosyltransferase family 9 protein n=1 Tax=Seleniivibrio woodruffii TaxID=1078050 RepID=UPI0039E5E629